MTNHEFAPERSPLKIVLRMRSAELNMVDQVAMRQDVADVVLGMIKLDRPSA